MSNDPWAVFRYSGQSSYQGQPGTTEQQAYANANRTLLDQNAPVGTPQNPSYDTPDVTGSNDIAHVNLKGQLSAPDDWSGFRGEPKVGAGEDVLRTIPGGLARGVTATAGVLGDAQNIGQRGFNWVADRALGVAQDMTGNDFGVAHHPHTQAVDHGILDGGGITSADLNHGVQDIAGPYHEPQSWQGRAADTASGVAASTAIFPGSLLAKAMRIAVPTAGSAAAGEATRGTKYEPAARIAGLLAGGTLQNAGESIANAPTRLMSKALAGTTPEQLADAIRLQQSAASLPGGGIHITPPEALGSPGMLGLQHFAENAPAGRALAAPIFADRPEAVARVVRALADRVAPADTAPAASAIRNQGAAQGVLTQQRQAINATASPHYEALESNVIPDEQFQTLAGVPAYADALAQVRGDKLLNADIAHLPDNDLAVVNETVKKLDQSAMAHQQTATNPAGDNRRASLYTAARAQADQLAGDVSPDWRAARDIVAQGHEQVLDPLAGGPVGRIAKTDQIPRQVGALFPAKPPEGSAVETAAAASMLPPEVTANITRHHLIDALNSENVGTMAGPSQWVGGRYAKAIAGHDERAAALDATLRALDSTGDLSAHKDALIEALRATGKRVPPGSGTAFNDQQASVFGKSPGPVGLVTKILDPLHWGQAIDHAVGGRLYERNVQQIIKMLQSTPEQAAPIMGKASGSRELAAATRGLP